MAASSPDKREGSSLRIRYGSPADTDTIIRLARSIWPVTYREILSDEQLQYMLNLFYSGAALRKQMVELGHRFILLEEDQDALGYASYSSPSGSSVVTLHKIYVLPGMQGRGLGKFIIEWIREEVTREGKDTIRLNVNRYNKARQFYERMGFTVVGEEDIDIGSNYFMNDFIMEKKC